MQKPLNDPAFRCQAYLDQWQDWFRLKLAFDGPKRWIRLDPKTYTEKPILPLAKLALPSFAAEDEEAWESRLLNATWDDRFAQSVRRFAKFVLANGVKLDGVTSANRAIAQHWETNIAQPSKEKGVNGSQFTYDGMVDGLLYGHTFILVDYPSGPAPQSQAELDASGRRPYWRLISPLQITDWVHDGYQLQQVTINESGWVRSQNALAQQWVERYRIWRPGEWILVQVFEGKDSQGRKIRIPKVIDRGGCSLPYIPLVPCYGDLHQGVWGVSRPPLRALADANFAHYRTGSEHRVKMHYCSSPTPVIVDPNWDVKTKLTTGPGKGVVISEPRGRFFWAEPLATSLEQSRLELADLERRMTLLDSSYLITPADREAATTTEVKVGELESSLQTFVQIFAGGINRALQVHAEYLQLDSAPTVALSGEVIQERGRDAGLLAGYASLPEKDLLSKRTTIEVLKATKFLPEDVVFDGDEKLNDNVPLMKEIIGLGLQDGLSKAEVLQLLKQHGFLASGFDVAASVAATGTEFKLLAIGASGLHVQPQ